VPVDEVAVSPSGGELGDNGYRVLVRGAGAGAFVGHDNELATWNDSNALWEFDAPVSGMAVIDASTGILYTYNGTTWVISGGGFTTVSEVILSFPDTVPAGTAINIQTGVYGGGGPATVFGDLITLPAVGATFKTDGRVQVHLNGQNLFKGDSIGDETANWVSSTQLAFDVKVKKFSIVKVVTIS